MVFLFCGNLGKVNAEEIERQNGYHEMEFDVPSFAEEKSEDAVEAYGVSALPPSYSSASAISASDVRNCVTKVKNQGSTSMCWAFAAISAAETSRIMDGAENVNTVDFDEEHLAYFTYNRPVDVFGLTNGDVNVLQGGSSYADAGGNVGVAMMAFANWIGAANEGTYQGAVSGINATSIGYLQDAAHLENANIITMPDMRSTNYQADMKEIKKNIMEYGSMGISYAYYSTYENGLYYHCPNDLTENHAVAIVGWDDNISASSFKNAPAGDGAWIVKNSWGQYNENGGYFYLSYYDKSLSNTGFFFDFGSKENYDNNYQYDGGGNFTGAVNMMSDEICGANVFQADSEEKLKAVSVFTQNLNVGYTIEIYKNWQDNGNPTSGTCVASTSGKVKYAGYHTIPLNTEVKLNKGERYAVVVTLKKSGETVYMGCDYSGDYGWIKFTSTAKSGQSYLGTSKTGLVDLNAGMANWGDGMNLRIKAFTDEVPVELKGICYNINSDSIDVGVAYEAAESNVKFRWLAYNLDTGVWEQISDWYAGNWATWKPQKGNYWLQAQAMDTRGKVESMTICFCVDKDYSGRELLLNGICYILNDKSIDVGVAYEAAESNVKFRWLAYNLDTGVWEQISDWYAGNWMTWHPKKGNYWLHVEAQNAYGRTESSTICFAVGKDYIEKPLELSGICYVSHGNSIDVGVAYDTNRSDVEFQWLAYNLDTGEWKQVSNWYAGNWATWYPEPGNYWLHVEARSGTDVYEAYTTCFAVNY